MDGHPIPVRAQVLVIPHTGLLMWFITPVYHKWTFDFLNPAFPGFSFQGSRDTIRWSPPHYQIDLLDCARHNGLTNNDSTESCQEYSR